MDSKPVHDRISEGLKVVEELGQLQTDVEIHKLRSATMLVDAQAQIEPLRQHPRNQTLHIVLWELHSGSNRPARCAYQSAPTAGHFVTVIVGNTECFREQHSTETHALDEASYLLDYFLLNGWTDVTYRDPRIRKHAQ